MSEHEEGKQAGKRKGKKKIYADRNTKSVLKAAKILSSHVLESVLDSITKNFHLSVGLDGKEAVRISFENEKIIIDVKNPLIAAQLAVETSLLARKFKKTKDDFKKLGYKIEVRYGILKVDI